MCTIRYFNHRSYFIRVNLNSILGYISYFVAEESVIIQRQDLKQKGTVHYLIDRIHFDLSTIRWFQNK